jgi:hypothetical protein
MARRVRIGTVLVGVGAALAVATAWGGVARASGNELGALRSLFQLAAAVAGVLPWAISFRLLFSKPSPSVWVWGMLTAATATVFVLVSELPPQAVYVSVAVLPAVAHLFKRARAEQRWPSG